MNSYAKDGALILDKELQGGQREIEHTCSIFPGGEINFRITDPDIHSYDLINIVQRVRSSEDFMKILMAANAIDNLPQKPMKTLTLGYMPYARQDRICNPGEAFGLKVVANLLNNCGFGMIRIVDAHSTVTPALLDNCQNESNLVFVTHAFNNFFSLYPNITEIALVAPDAGAVKKIMDLAKEQHETYPDKVWSVVKCDKTRNLATGEIIRTDVLTNSVPAHCVIVDDIVDGGRTVIEVAKALRVKGAITIGFMVTHGIFSKGTEVFNGVIDYIATTNCFRDFYITGTNEEDAITNTTPNASVGFKATNFYIC